MSADITVTKEFLRACVHIALEEAFDSGIVTEDLSSMSKQKFLKIRKHQITKEFFKRLREGYK